ncbi:MAG: imidazolonepropionase [Gemmatimonadetes bacterium]|nr:imidazolonepropionase [Gemmatimonadota bacterium]
MEAASTIWTNTNVATFSATSAEPYGAVLEGAVAVRGGRILWVGHRDAMPAGILGGQTETVDLGGRWMTPGLIDCHTHLVFAGDRADEFERRLLGESYEEIARSGGGIRSTVTATRAASFDTLLSAAERRLRALASEGVTTVEIKSGYGLELDTEMRMLQVALELERRNPIRVVGTLLGAHALPEEFEGRSAEYLEVVCEEMIPRAAEEGLAACVDAFCEEIAFTAEECGAVFDAAKAHGLPVRLHADQLSDSGGAALAAGHGALSADHLEFASEAGVRAMAAAGTVAVLLPGAFYTLRQTRPPPVDALRESGVPIALATDANPGSSPVLSPLTILQMGCTLFGLTPEEALAGMTRNGARALGLGDEIGTIEEGKAADFAVWDIDHPRELCYWLGGTPCHSVISGGEVASYD